MGFSFQDFPAWRKLRAKSSKQRILRSGNGRRNPTFNSNLPTFPSLIGSFLGAIVVFGTGKIGYAKFVVCPTPMSKSVFIFMVKMCF